MLGAGVPDWGFGKHMPRTCKGAETKETNTHTIRRDIVAEIAVVRVDSRLIHGQVLSRWVSAVNANRIIIIDNDLSNDPYVSSIFKMSTPPGTQLTIMNPQQAAAAYNKDGFGEGIAIVMFKKLGQALEAHRLGFAFSELQVAGLGSGPDRRNVFRTVSMTDKGALILKQLHAEGVRVYFQSLPDEPELDAIPKLTEQFAEVFYPAQA